MTLPRLRILLFNTAHRWVGEAASTDLLARTMAARGHNVAMVIPESGSTVGEHLEKHPERIQNIELIRVPWRLMQGRGSGSRAQFLAVRRLLKSWQPDIIHAARSKEHWCAALLRPITTPRARIIRTRHVVLPMRERITSKWLFTKGTDAALAVSSAALKSYGRIGAHFSDAQRRVILGAVEAENFSPARRRTDIRADLGATSDDTILVGLLARAQRVKGQDIFAEALAAINDRHPRVRGVMAGRNVGLQRPRVADAHERFKLEGRVEYRGMVDNIEEIAAALDIGVIASRGSEGFSRIAVEYMASGVPVVATSVGALPEMIRDGENGLLVAPEDPAALAHAIERMITDNDLRERCVATGLHEARTKYHPDRLATEMEEVYAAILNKA